MVRPEHRPTSPRLRALGAINLLLRFFVTAQGRISSTRVVMGLGHLRHDGHGALQFPNDIVRTVEIKVELSERFVRFCVVREGLDGALKGLNRGLGLFPAAVDDSEVEGGGEVGRVSSSARRNESSAPSRFPISN